MKFVIARQELNNLVSKAINVVSTKPTIPILSNFLIEATDDTLTITATDLTVGVRCFTQAKVVKAGATTVPAKRFAQLIRELTSHNIEISETGGIIEIVADSSQFKLHGMSHTEFPSLPDLGGSTRFSLKQTDLRDMLARTAFAVSRDDNRYILTGVCMKIGDGQVTLLGTDGRRLARVYTSAEVDQSISGEYVLPIKAVDEVLKSFEDQEEECTHIHLMEDKVAFEGNKVTFISKLITGDYPELDSVIPQGSDSIVSLHREELMTLLRQVALFTADANHSVRFTLSDGELKLSANAMDVGEGKVSMPVNYQGSRLDIAFNPGFFLDILRHSKEETVSLGLTDSYNPGIITDKELSTTMTSVPSPIYVLMPMRLNED